MWEVQKYCVFVLPHLNQCSSLLIESIGKTNEYRKKWRDQYRSQRGQWGQWQSLDERICMGIFFSDEENILKKLSRPKGSTAPPKEISWLRYWDRFNILRERLFYMIWPFLIFILLCTFLQVWQMVLILYFFAPWCVCFTKLYTKIMICIFIKRALSAPMVLADKLSCCCCCCCRCFLYTLSPMYRRSYHIGTCIRIK